MKIPLHWSKGSVEEVDRDGRKIAFSCWRSSDRSEEDAQQSALEAAAGVLRRMLAGQKQFDRYTYGETPLREEVIERFTGSQDDLIVAVTRNAYGSLVLNAARVMFVDIDFPAIPLGDHLRHFLARLFGRSAPSPEARQEHEAQERLQQFVGDHPSWGFRMYRTRAGLRAIATHDLFDPASEEALTVFQSLGTDPLYVRLCKAQECFRARLTPKPWRCGHSANTVGWPRESDDQQNRFREWLASYTSSQSAYATCRYLGSIGNEAVHPEVETILAVHDKVTHCLDSLELA